MKLATWCSMTEQLKTALKCLATSIVATLPDASGHTFCHLQCEAKSGCKDMNFCLSIKKHVEEELNGRQKAQDHKVS